MDVVLVGDRDRDTVEDKQLVLSLLENLKQKYSSLVMVSTACDRGIGAFVKDRCLPKVKITNPDFKFIEVNVKVWAVMPRARLARIYVSRNAALCEIGEEFYVFVSSKKQGQMVDLIDRVKKLKRPLTIYHMDGQIEEHNIIKNDSTRESTESISSSDLKGELE